MRLKIDIEIPNWTRWLVGGIAMGVVLGAGAVVLAQVVSVPNTFADGNTLSAAKMNANFKTLQDAVNQATPPGTIVAFGGPIVPSGWLLCDGASVKRADYPGLFTAIGTVHGAGDGASTFNLPDYRGIFLRGADSGASRDPDATRRTAPMPGGNFGDLVGSVQTDALGSHSHPVLDPGHAHSVYATYPGQNLATGGFLYAGGSMSGGPATPNAETGVSVQAAGGLESRPKNAYVNYIIKY
jgi:microcystin-dependent protein